jgi:hypothetical protein
MLRHIVMITFTEGTSQEPRERAVAELNALPALIPSIRAYRVGLDAGIVEGAHDLVIVGDFDDIEGWRAYQDHPDHVRVRDEHLRPHMAERATIQHYWER